MRSKSPPAPLRSRLRFLSVLALLGTVLAVTVSCAQNRDSRFPLKAKKAPERYLVFVGTYTGGRSEGIYVLALDTRTGVLERIGVAKSENPSFLALHPNGRYLYAVNEIGSFRGEKSGAVSAFAIDPKSGGLSLLGQQPTGGGAPCHLVVDSAGKNVLVANYGGGSVCSLAIGADGNLAPMRSFVQHEGSSVNPQRQRGPHAHSIDLDAANRFAFSCDLGLDKVLVYRFDPASGKLTPNDPPSASVPPGSGPRHFAFTPDGRFAYVNNEITSTISSFSYDAARGSLKTIGGTVSSLPDGYEGGNSTAEIAVHPSGRFLYCSNRGHDSIAVFAIDRDSGALTLVEHELTGGRTPRNFAIDPSGTYLLAENQGTNTIAVFRVDLKSGGLDATGNVIQVPSPVCVQFLAAD